MIDNILPPSATDWERAVAGALTEPLDAEMVQRVKSPTLCPEHLLPYLAAERNVDEWSSDWPEALKRMVIARSWRDHQRKGTPAAMDAAVSSLGPHYSWRPWFEYDGQPYRFRLECAVPADGLTLNEILRARRTANAAKNVRSLMEFVAESDAEAPARAGAFAVVMLSIGDIQPVIPTAGVAIGGFSHLEISHSGDAQ